MHIGTWLLSVSEVARATPPTEVAPLLDAKYWADFAKDAIAAIVGAGVGAWLGARAAFRLERSKALESHIATEDEARQRLLEMRAAAGNLAMFALAQIHNDLSTYKVQCVDVADQGPIPWFFQSGIDLHLTSSHRFDISSLGFLFQSRDPEMPLKLKIQEDRYVALFDVVRRRNHLHQEKAVPILESKGRLISAPSDDEFKTMLGSNIYYTLTNYASDIRVILDGGLSGSLTAANELRALLIEMLPGHTIIGFAPRAVPESPVEAARMALSRSRDTNNRNY